MSLRIVIVGGVAGGASAAAKARRVNETADITVFERGAYVSFANCGLPYYIADDISKRDALILQSPESFWRRFRVTVKVRHEVLRIDRAKKQIEVRDLTSKEVFFKPYDKLILAPGAGAIVPQLSGIAAENVFTVKTVPDSDAIKEYIALHKPRRGVVIGAGFIGLESAEALHKRGLAVSVVEKESQVLPPFDSDMAAFVAWHLEAAGLTLILGDGVKAFHGGARAKEVELASGRKISMDLAILSIGVRPELKLAQEAGLSIGRAGGITVDDHQRTSDPDIYAAGDAVEVFNRSSGQTSRMPLAGPANKQGRVAGANAAGGELAFAGAYGTAIVETMGMTAAKTGLSEREAAGAKIPYYVSLTHSADHATYYPGSALLHMKLVAEEGTGRLLGAQVVGERGVDKRIDVLATSLAARMSVSDLEQLDLAYAPQFSSAKDPVVMAGFVAANVLRHEVGTITCEALRDRLSAGDRLQIVDVRTMQEHASGHLPQAILIPIDELRERIGELDPSKETIVYCKVGLRGYLAARILRQHGFFRVLNLTGGLLSCPPPSAKVPIAAPSASKVSNGIASISPEEARQAAKSKSARLIDVREPEEYSYERAQEAANIPLSTLSRQTASLVSSGPIYVLCQSGLRSREAADILHRAGCNEVRVVEGGLIAWKQAGFPVRQFGPLPIMRQVQIAAGSLVILGLIIPHLWGLSLFVGAGLVFAGLSGTCAMAILLSKMPWNAKRNSLQSSCAPSSVNCTPDEGVKPQFPCRP